MQDLAERYPALTSLYTAQDRFGLSSAGSCPSPRHPAETVPCKVWVLEISHRASLEHHRQRPDVLISGALHGDERVGPLATLHLAKWLLGRYDFDPWARRLVNTRRLLLVPAANAVGFAARTRNELRSSSNVMDSFASAACCRPST